VETFERFLKEVAADCVDCLAEYVVDDRSMYSDWKLAAALRHERWQVSCESSTWLDCEEIKSDRAFATIPNRRQSFDLFEAVSAADKPAVAIGTDELRQQIRHRGSGVGVITRSDAVKLRQWARENVDAQ
jgi:hypothetical protein